MSGVLTSVGGARELVPGRVKPIVIAGFAVIVAGGALPGYPGAPAAAVAALVAVAAAAALIYVLRLPLLAVAVATAGIAVEGDGFSSDIGWLAACLLAGWCVIVVSQRTGLIYWAALLILFAVEWVWVRPDPGWAAWLAGSSLTVLCALLIRHQIDLNARLRAAQAGLAEQARTAERNRIARELHDVIGHTLVVSLLHVQSARLAVEHDPADAARALAEAERLGQECLAEVRMTVGMLSEAHDGEAGPPAVMAPLPGVEGLPALVERFRSAGADVTLTVQGDTSGLPATTGLAVYRIAQEALTNAAKHAPGTPTTMLLSLAAGQVTLTADSSGPPGSGTGLGVISMRERAGSLGGTCEAGPGGRGWLVRATLPLDASPRPQSAKTAP
ncbi:MAG: sensor histidine kinase [Streptosporangiaceae bacterium]